MTEAAISPEKNLVDLTISLFYILIPFIWLMIAGWAGAKIGMTLMGINETSGSAGKTGGLMGGHLRHIAGKGVGKFLGKGSNKG